MELVLEPYCEQVSLLPAKGRHILAQFSDNYVVVYQAYGKNIGYFAAQHGYFGAGFHLDRLSWIKTSFLWLMYRCRWGTLDGMHIILAIWLKRSAFDLILQRAVYESFLAGVKDGVYSNKKVWKKAYGKSSARLQWDPDRTPTTQRLERKAIQLGLSGESLAKYAREWIIKIKDISSIVRTQHRHVRAGNCNKLLVPQQRLYPVSIQVAKNIGL